jgi:adenylate kinase family enzyme
MENSSEQHHSLFCGQRISIVGTSGSGKTTLARHLAERLNFPHVELDALHWEPNWTEATDQVFRSQVAIALSGNRWVVDGNYSKVRDLVWSGADTVVWLDYAFLTVLSRLLKRTLWRGLWQQELWNGNRESLQTSFFSQDSILLWMLQTYGKNRLKYPRLFQQPEHSHLTVIHFRSPQATDRWVSSLPHSLLR